MGRFTAVRPLPFRAAILAVAVLMALLCATPGGVPEAAGQVSEEALTPGDSLLSIRLTDGSTLVARIESVRGDRVVLVTEAGARVEVERASIRSMRPVATPFSDPNTSRLFFGPTGRTVPAGAGYIGLFELFFPFVSIGATDWLTLSGGTPIVPEVMGQIYYLAPKARVIDLPRFQASAGVLAFFETSGSGDSFGIGYGVGTLGDPDRSLTLGFGVPFVAGQAGSAKPVLLLGTENRVGRFTKVITENYVFTGEDGIIASVGARIFGERFSGDLGMGVWLDDHDAFCCLPVLNVVYTFGQER